MRNDFLWKGLRRGLLVAALVFSPAMSLALTTSFSAPDAPETIQSRLQAASSVMSAEANGLDTAQELLAAALSDYRTLVQILYDEGFFSPVVNIKINGREAATIPALEPPRTVNTIAISVQTGRPFRFGQAQVSPLAPGTELPEGFKTGQPANTAILRDASAAGILAWRNAGHAKAKVGDKRIVGNHAQAVLDADIELLPGPKLKFGRLTVPQDSAVRPEAMTEIAGFPTGEVFEPAKVQKVGTRLRRTGAFSSITLREAKTPNPDGTLDFEAVTIDQVPRRVSFGVEVSSRNGLDLSAKWIHRNLFGAAERFQIEGRIRNLGGTENVDGLVALRLDQPASLGPDSNLFYLAGLGRENKPHYSLMRGYFGVGVRRVYSDDLFAEIHVGPEFNRADDAFGLRDFQLLPIPLHVEWDKRDIRVSATRGFFLDSYLTPFVGFSDTKSGLAAAVDARGYLSLTSSSSIVLAGRIQLGTVLGPSLSEISPQYLFFSGGAGTVRGQPYQSLGIPVGTGLAGGRSFLGLSTEIRGKITEKISLVGFFDIAAVDDNYFVDNNSPYHSGAGLGLRYDLGGLGPLRLDLALPVDGPTGDGLQFYLGIGQAF